MRNRVLIPLSGHARLGASGRACLLIGWPQVKIIRRHEMTEWQDGTTDQSVLTHELERDMRQASSARQQVALMLVAAIEQIEHAYIMGSIDRAEYAAQMEEVNDKLAIVGLSLAVKPKTSNRVVLWRGSA